jgi:hypothetical protein
MTSRRIFLKNITNIAVVSAAAVTAASLSAIPMLANAQAAKVEENDPQAKALGYVHDSAKADQAKFPKHTVAQKCANCQLFQGKATDATGACPLFAGKLVASTGWCSAYAKKA